MFKRILDSTSAAKQVAGLLNSYNQLNTHYNAQNILDESASYTVESIGKTVIGCVQVQKQAYMLSEIKHLCVHPSMRKQGFAKMLITSALDRAPTPMVYATIREENIGSIKAFESCGFKRVGEYATGTRKVFIFMAICPKWQNKVDKSQIPVYNESETGGAY